MEKDEYKDQDTESQTSLTEAGNGGNANADPEDQFGTPWHMAAESIMEYVVIANASPSSTDDIRISKESQLDVTVKNTRTPDLSIALLENVQITGPIGEYLGSRSTLEYKSPTDTCTLETLMRSGVYTLQYALDKTDVNSCGLHL